MSDRNNEVDILKGLLTMGMVFAHSVQFLNGSKNPILEFASRLTNLVSFSGFLGCFGFACWLAYISKPTLPWKKVISTSFKCYLAFAISGIAFRCLVAGAHLDARLCWRVFLLRETPGYSEFLIAFALITVSSCVLASPIRFLTVNIKRTILFSLLVLLSAQFLPKEAVYHPLLGLFLGGSGSSYFPVLLYSPIFILGMWVARHRHQYNISVMIASMVGVLMFLALPLMKVPISRFPPDAPWIACSAAMVYLYYGAALFITTKFPYCVKLYINAVGQNVLLYLLTTNLALFACAALARRGTFTAYETVAAYCVLMSIMYFFQLISIDLQRANQSIKPTGHGDFV